MPECPNCGTDVGKPYKTWVISNSKTNVDVEIGLFVCPHCATKFRKGHRI